MDHVRILKRAFQIVKDYRVLWVFGILLALTAASNGSGNNGANAAIEAGSGGGNGGAFPPFYGFPFVPERIIGGILAAVIGLFCIIFLLGLVFAVVRYVSETALIHMVNRHEETGEKNTFREGWSFGWSRTAFRVFLVDLVFGLSALVILILLLLVAGAPLLLLLTRSEGLSVLGVIASIGLGMLVILAFILGMIILSLLLPFFRRAVVLEDLGVFDGIRRGFRLVKSRLWDVVLMGLIIFGINIGFSILMIPVVLLLVLAGLVIGGLPALLIYFVLNLFMEGAAPAIIAGVIGAPIFFLIIVIPSLIITGLLESYKSTVWTLTYRELLALESGVVVPGPEPEIPSEPEPELPPGEPVEELPEGL